MDYHEQSRIMAKAIVDEIAKRLRPIRLGVLWLCIGYLVWAIFFQETDSTDKSKYERSGLKIYTDNATGFEYIGTGNGGLTRRLK